MILSFPTLNRSILLLKLLIYGSASAIRASNNSACAIGVDLVEISFSQHRTTHLPVATYLKFDWERRTGTTWDPP